MKIAAVLVAAGTSSRMGGENKMLLPWAESTVVSGSLNELANSNVSEIVVVTGRDAQKVEAEINRQQLTRTRTIYNPDFGKGLTTSIQTGIGAIKQGDAVMICMADMPLLQAQDYQWLIDQFSIQEKSIQVPYFGQQRANPVIFGQRHFQEILNHQSMNGCSGVVQQNPDLVVRVQVQTNRFIQDIDSPEDYQKLKDAIK